MSHSSKLIVVTHYELIANQPLEIDLPNSPFLLVIAIHSPRVNTQWRYDFCDWVVRNDQCYHAMTWGFDCAQWETDLDLSYIEKFNYALPDDFAFLTTWHTDETFDEVMQLAKLLVGYALDEETEQIVLINIR